MLLLWRSRVASALALSALERSPPPSPRLLDLYLFRIVGRDQKPSIDAAASSQPARSGHVANQRDGLLLALWKSQSLCATLTISGFTCDGCVEISGLRLFVSVTENIWFFTRM
jgi:hypothetical protein